MSAAKKHFSIHVRNCSPIDCEKRTVNLEVEYSIQFVCSLGKVFYLRNSLKVLMLNFKIDNSGNDVVWCHSFVQFNSHCLVKDTDRSYSELTL